MARRTGSSIFSAAGNVTTAGNSGQHDNQSVTGIVVAIVSCGTPTGTTPSLTPQLDGSVDGGATWTPIKAGAAMTAAGSQRISATDAIESLVRVSWPAPTGTTPSFPSFKVTFLFDREN